MQTKEMYNWHQMETFYLTTEGWKPGKNLLRNKPCGNHIWHSDKPCHLWITYLNYMDKINIFEEEQNI